MADTDRLIMMTEARRAFDMADKDCNGKIDQDEMVDLIQIIHANMGKPWISKYSDKIKEKAAKSMCEFDTDGDGYLSFQEFVQMLSTGKPWTVLLRPTIEGAEFDNLKQQYESWKGQPAPQPAAPAQPAARTQSSIPASGQTNDFHRSLEAHAALLRQSYPHAPPPLHYPHDDGMHYGPTPFYHLMSPHPYGPPAHNNVHTAQVHQGLHSHMYGSGGTSASAVSRESDPNAHLLAARSSAADLGYRVGQPIPYATGIAPSTATHEIPAASNPLFAASQLGPYATTPHAYAHFHAQYPHHGMHPCQNPAAYYHDGVAPMRQFY